MKGPLSHIKVLELEGLAPSVHCGMILADYGADVTILARNKGGAIGMEPNMTFLNRGKKCMKIDL